MRIKQIEIAPEVAEILQKGTWDGLIYHLPDGQLDRKTYEACNKVLLALGGKWNRGSKGHVFNKDAGIDFAAALAAGAVVNQKKTYEQFFTPEVIAERMAREFEISSLDLILEPSAGSGRLIEAAIKAGADEELVTAIEIDEGLSFDLAHRYPRARVVNMDFMADGLSVPWADLVLMNPPFGQNADIRHVRRAYDFLAQNGRMAAIMSNHWTFANDRESIEFRDFVDQIEARWEILPTGSFIQEGTGVNVGLLLATNRG